jgi:hypothetical protein
MREHPTRRDFVSQTSSLLGSGWLWLNLPAISTLSACAMDAARNEAPFVTLTADEGAAVRSFASRIIPSDDTGVGAEEAGAAWFVDGALGGPMAGMLDPIRAGLADLDQRARSKHGVSFADAYPADQDAIIEEVVDTQFFQLTRMLVVMGVFADPVHGGNRNHVGFTVLQMEHEPSYQPPFGHYDAEYARKGGIA